MDEKAILGFVLWLSICVGCSTVFTVPERTGLACLGNILGLALLIWVLRLPSVRERLAEPRFVSLLLLIGIIPLGTIISVGLGQMAYRL